MKVKTLNGIMKVVNRISNPSSLTSLYRAVELTQTSIKACSEYGNIHILAQEDCGIQKAVLLEAAALQAVVNSLPQSDDITFEEKENKVNWKCGSAKGSLNHVVSDYNVPQINHDKFPWTPAEDFSNALLLASCACQAAAVSLGLYGVAVEPIDGDLYLMSSNTITLAATKIVRGDFPDRKITIRPPVPSIIATLLASCPNCTLDVCDDGIFIVGDWLMAQLPLGQPLEHNLKELADKYSEAKEVAGINTAAVKKFLTRARNLTEKQLNFTVSLKVEEGNLVLTHQGISSASEEWFLAEGLPKTTNYKPITLAADLLVIPLEFIQTVVLDYIKDDQIVLKGDNPKFSYIIGGGN
jgi:hypothetical protein